MLEIIFNLFLALFNLLAAMIAAYATLCGARLLHDGLLKNILRCPMSFFDTTPKGRILNRFAKDVDAVDTVLPGTFRSILTGILSVRIQTHLMS